MILAAGQSGNSTFTDFALTRYLPDGSLDPGFGIDGRVTTNWYDNDQATSVALQTDGKILVCGIVEGFSHRFALLRYLPDGSPDLDFGYNGRVTTEFEGQDDLAWNVLETPDGKILVAGAAEQGDFGFAVARYLSDGSLDSTFSDDGKQITAIGEGFAISYALAIGPDGRIVLAGNYSQDGNNQFALVRYLQDGSLDTGFGSDGVVTNSFGTSSVMFDIAIQPDGKIVGAGHSSDGTMRFVVMRYLSDGSLDDGFGNGGIQSTVFSGNASARSVALAADGKILAAGNVWNGTNNDFALVRLLSQGTLDPEFGSEGKVTTAILGDQQDYAASMALQEDGRIILVGSSSVGTSTSVFALSRYLATNEVGVRENGAEVKPASVWPNPTMAHMTLEFSRSIEGTFNIRVVDLAGRDLHIPVLSSADIGKCTRVRLDMSHIAPGGYTAIIEQEGRRTTASFIKQ